MLIVFLSHVFCNAIEILTSNHRFEEEKMSDAKREIEKIEAKKAERRQHQKAYRRKNPSYGAVTNQTVLNTSGGCKHTDFSEERIFGHQTGEYLCGLCGMSFTKRELEEFPLR